MCHNLGTGSHCQKCEHPLSTALHFHEIRGNLHSAVRSQKKSKSKKNKTHIEGAKDCCAATSTTIEQNQQQKEITH